MVGHLLPNGPIVAASVNVSQHMNVVIVCCGFSKY